MPFRLRLFCGLAPALALLLAATGCDALSGPASGNSAGMLAAAAKKLDDGLAYHVQATTTMSSGDANGAVVLRVDTEGDVASPRRARLTLTSPQQPDLRFDLVLYDDDLYVRTPSGDWEQLPASQLTELGPSPVDVGAFLQVAAGNVEDKGAEDVRGVKARRFAFQVDLPKLAERMEGLGRPITTDMLKAARVDVWLSEPDTLVQRSKVSLDLAGGGGVMEMDSYTSSHGKPVTLERPAVEEPTLTPSGQ